MPMGMGPPFVAAALVVLVAAIVPAHAAPEGTEPAALALPFVPSISIQSDGPTGPSDYAGREGIDASQLRGRLGASGIVRCGGAIGTAQLTLRADVITTAAHVLIGPQGLRGGACMFEPASGNGGAAVAIDARSIRAGSTRPLSEPAARDWAVARLVAPIGGAVPYGLGALQTFPSGVTMYAGGNGRADGMGVERCRARHVIGTSPEGVREIAIDCNAAPGASGAALLDAQHRIVAIYVGYRSASPDQAQPFSRSHYNFAISADGPFRRALLGAAGRR